MRPPANVTIALTDIDLDHLSTGSMRRDGSDPEPFDVQRFDPLIADEPLSDQWRRGYLFDSHDYSSVVLARAYLTARGEAHQVAIDRDTADYIILTNYEQE